ncbi:low molecular weight phosphatase family protein [Cupriavidus sp. USMAA2-4]|uniref:arsenate reductase ArsC n=1 Tax=Cupriavidus sp. USMAA2-4 TaxID=876364 RepID=UPI0008A6A0DC|nr:arsenate reductase ArsC [Cupriavidus sp. USMAA2-4]AOY95023.1 low molecular weight phosphatase family protein [Cupriavidus sp. USMAA2-4]
MGGKTTNVLILCTHNSARSVLSEGMLNHLAQQLGRDVRAYSAGSAPSGRINPFAIEALQNAGVETAGFRSKSWDEFVADDAPRMRVVITVCDSAAAEQCPYWPGSPVKVHWGYADPSNAQGGDDGKRIAFELTRQAIGYRMLQLLQLPLEEMSDAELQQHLERISQS